MATCKDCIYHDVCTFADDIRFQDDICKYCERYKDKSRYIELPCKLGDKVYQTDGCRVYESTISEIEMSFKNTVYCTENIAFDERAIDRSIFLTREKAEKALKEGGQK